MKYLVVVLLFVSSVGYTQLTTESVRDSTIIKYHIAQYSYHEQFVKHKGYGAPVILTNDGGGAVFGDGDEGCMLVRLGKNGKEMWKKTIPAKGDEMESQSVVEDKAGNFYVFMLVHDETKARAGCERAVFMNKAGTIVWDKFIGSCAEINNPTVSYIKALPDGRVALRGHVSMKKPPEGQDPTYVFWEGWLDKTGKMTQKTGQVIDWKKTEEWQKLYKPE